jgi:hypothetical protein
MQCNNYTDLDPCFSKRKEPKWLEKKEYQRDKNFTSGIHKRYCLMEDLNEKGSYLMLIAKGIHPW